MASAIASAGEAAEPERIGFLLVPKFSMIAFFSAVEPLRVANRLSGRQLYSWTIFSPDGKPVAASNGMTLLPDAAIDSVDSFPSLVVCASFQPEKAESEPLLAWLRRLDRTGAALGAVDTGTHVLARAGLLDGYRVTLHWESLSGFAEEFPDLNVTGELFEIDRRRFTAAGGTAPLDMMLHRIAARHGLDHTFEDTMREIRHLVDQMTSEEREAYLTESLFLNTVTYENEKAAAYVSKLTKSGS